MNFKINKISPTDHRGLLKSVNLIFIFLLVALAVLKIVLAEVKSLPIPAIVVIAGCLTNIIYLKRNGNTQIAARALLGILLIGFALGSINTGGYNGPIVIFAPIIPILALVLIDSRAALKSLVLVGLALVGVFILQAYGFIPENPNPLVKLQFGRFITLLSLCFMLTWIIWNFSRNTNALLIKTKSESNTDFLTGILNRRAIEATLRDEVNRAKRTGEWLSLIMADVDHFKRYNDTNGHQAGDECLKKVARVILSCYMRSTDVVGRFGGEEFLLILPNTNDVGAQIVAERIRTKLLAEKIPYGNDSPDVLTITSGTVSANGKSIESVEQLIKCADDALYQGKNQGRNCVANFLLDTTQTARINRINNLKKPA